VPFDVAAGEAGCGDGDAVFDGDLVGAGFHGDLGGLARVRQADLDPLPADHDRTADRYPPPDGERAGQLRWPGGCGAGTAQPVPGRRRDWACDGAHDSAGGEDVRDRPVQAHGDALPGQW
jgi:hypothetical protein